MKIHQYIFFLFVVKSAFADSVFIENVDQLNVKLFYGDTLYMQNNNKRSYDARNPKSSERWIRVVFSNTKDSKTALDLKLRSSYSNNGAPYGCNYSILMTKNFGWKLVSNEMGDCSPSQNHYHPKAAYTYTLKNDSKIPVYPAFSVEKVGDFSSDSIHGYLKPGESRIYSTTTSYWKSIHVKDKVQVGFYNPYSVSYVPCSSELSIIDKEHTFSFNKDHKCEKVK